LSIDCKHFQITENCEHCQELQKQWYEKLKKKGFEDIEDTSLRILKKWTGIPIGDPKLFDVLNVQEAEAPLQTNWPETKLQKENDFLHHPEFRTVCDNLFRHGNNVISHEIMVNIWELHCEGFSLREIEKQFNIHNSTIFRAINRVREMANLMNDNSKTIVIRQYNPNTDAPLLFASWRNSIWFDAHPAELKPNPVFYRIMTKKINNMLRNPETEIRIACLADDCDEIKGYSVFCSNILEFVYVKLDYRHQGIATLLSKGFSSITKPMTKIGKAIADKKNLKIKENQNGRNSNPPEEKRA
jgi:predicted DNA-binding protein YlxM (UPF0122 family)